MSDESTRQYDVFTAYRGKDESGVQSLIAQLEARDSIDVSVLSSTQPTQHITATPGLLGGKPHIKGHRISVQDVAIWHERMGMSVDEIASEYALTVGEVYAALAYYHDHREEIEARIRQGAAMVEDLKQRTPSELPEK